MNKNILLLLTIFFTFFAFNTKLVYAAVDCSQYDKNSCKNVTDCQWSGGVCRDKYVAQDPCNDVNVKTALRFLGYLLMIARVAIPLIIIVMGTFDIYKSVVDKDEKSLSKQVKILIMRIVAGIFIFFLPTLIYAIFDLSTELSIVSEAKYEGCATCLLKPTDCNIN